MIKINDLPPMLTKEDTEELYSNWTEESWKLLAERNLRLATKTAYWFQNTGIEEEELIGIAILGLVKSAKKFDPKKNNMFSTFAIPTIRNEILQEIRKNKSHPYPQISLNELIQSEDGMICEKWDQVPSSFNTESYILAVDIVQTVNEVLNKETDKNKNVILNSIHGMKQIDNGKACGMPQSTVSRVIKRFKNKVLESYGG